ncbi:MAG: hypothetical protein ACOZHQ_03310 [Thermodesulfobacteriota bacterium]
MPRHRLAALVLALVLALIAFPGLASGQYSAADLEGVWQWEALTGTGGAIAFKRQDAGKAVVKGFTDYAIDDVYAMEGDARVAADGGVELDLKFMAEHHQNEFEVQNTCRGKFLAKDKIELDVVMNYTSKDGKRQFSRTWLMKKVPADKLPKDVRDKFGSNS